MRSIPTHPVVLWRPSTVSAAVVAGAGSALLVGAVSTVSAQVWPDLESFSWLAILGFFLVGWLLARLILLTGIRVSDSTLTVRDLKTHRIPVGSLIGVEMRTGSRWVVTFETKDGTVRWVGPRSNRQGGERLSRQLGWIVEAASQGGWSSGELERLTSEGSFDSRTDA